MGRAYETREDCRVACFVQPEQRRLTEKEKTMKTVKMILLLIIMATAAPILQLIAAVACLFECTAQSVQSIFGGIAGVCIRLSEKINDFIKKHVQAQTISTHLIYC